MKRLSWKYMAGLIDGEGCIDMQVGYNKKVKHHYCRPRLRMTLTGQLGKEVIENCVLNFGGYYEFRDRGNDNWLPAHTWALTGSVPLRSFLQNINNHLVLKKEQATYSIWWIDNTSGKHVTEEVRRKGVDELKAMKRDPQRLSERAIAEVQLLMR